MAVRGDTMAVNPDLLESVQRALEQDGLLQSIKAKIRSNVTKILKESEDYQRYVTPEVTFMNSTEGRTLLLIVKDLLEKLNLRESLVVLEAEAGMENLRNHDFSSLYTELGITDKKPTILESLIKSRKQTLSRTALAPPARSPATSPTRRDKQQSPTSVNEERVSPLKPVVHSSPPRVPNVEQKDDSEIQEDFEEDFEEDVEVDKKEAKDSDWSTTENKRDSYSPKSSERSPHVQPAASKSPSRSFDEFDAQDYKPSLAASSSPPAPVRSSISEPKPKSILAPLPDLKVASRFQFKVDDVLETVQSQKADSKLRAHESKEDNGPEVDSDVIEEDEDIVDEDFSQLDHDLDASRSDIHGAAQRQIQLQSTKEVVVEGTQRSPTADAGRQRANVTRAEAMSTRSTRGWNLPADDESTSRNFRDDDDDGKVVASLDPDMDESFDQTQSASSARGPGRRMFPIRTSPSPGRPVSSARSPANRYNNDAGHGLDLSQSQLSVAELDESHDQGNQLAASYRSNQEDEDDNDRPQANRNNNFMSQNNNNNNNNRSNNARESHNDSNPYDMEDEEDDDDDSDAGGGYVPSGVRAPVSAPAAAPSRLFTSSSAAPAKKVNESNLSQEDDYGEDFEQDDNDESSVMKKEEEEEEIVEEEEEVEEELSVGQQSSEDEGGGWGSNAAKPKNDTPASSSMFRQRSGALPAVTNSNSNFNSNNNNRPRHDFSALNDFDESDEDSPPKAKPLVQQRLSEVDRRLQELDEEDSTLQNLRASSNSNPHTSNNYNNRGGGPETGSDRDEASVASENLSVGAENSYEESFAMDD